MAEFEWKFEHRFSKLGNLQEEMLLQYRAKAEVDAVEISIIKHQGGNTVCQQRRFPGVSAEQGRQLVTFLYENAVPLEAWEDVMTDAFRRIRSE